MCFGKYSLIFSIFSNQIFRILQLMKRKNQKIVITGAPGSGKTSLIELLLHKGYICFPEVSREITMEARKKGVNQLFLHDPIAFSSQVIEKRRIHFVTASDSENVFFDRGMHDVIAYQNFLKSDYPNSFDEICKRYRYDCVFILPPWKKIFTTDDIRYESFDQAQSIHQHLINTYTYFSMTPKLVPFGSLEERFAYIEQQLKL